MHSSRYRLTSLPAPGRELSSRRWVRITPSSRPPYPTPPAPTPTRAIPRPAHVAARNESSVLFTLEHLHAVAAAGKAVDPAATVTKEKLRPPAAEAFLPGSLAAPPPPPLLAMEPEEERGHAWFLPVMVGASVSLFWSLVVAIIVIYYQTHPVVVTTAGQVRPAAVVHVPRADSVHAAQNAPAAGPTRQAKEADQDTRARPVRRVKLRSKPRSSRRSSRSRRRALLRRRRRAALRRRRARRIARARAKRRRARRSAVESPAPSPPPAPAENEPKRMTIDDLLDQASE